MIFVKKCLYISVNVVKCCQMAPLYNCLKNTRQILQKMRLCCGIRFFEYSYKKCK